MSAQQLTLMGRELWQEAAETLRVYPDVCATRHGGNECSAAANATTNKGRDRNAILAFLRTVYDATCDEVETALNMRHQTASARFSELKRDGAIIATTKRATRNGCMAQAWRVGEC